MDKLYVLYINAYIFISEHFLVQGRQAANHSAAWEYMGMTVSRNGYQPITAQYENMWGITLPEVAASMHVMMRVFLVWRTSGYNGMASPAIQSCLPENMWVWLVLLFHMVFLGSP